jgi:hypothetical protein
MRLALIAMLLVGAPALAQTPSKERVRLELELELAKANAAARVPATAARTETFTDYAAALAEASRLHRPVFVAVGIECGSLCPSLRGEMVTCHPAAPLQGVPEKCCLLGVPGPDGKIVKVAQWNGMLPSDAQVRHQADIWRQVEQAAKVQTVQPVPLCWADGT